MLTAYFDESYNHRTEKNRYDPLIYSVGCWLSTAERWKRFGKKWRAALASAGVESFHMKDYESRRGEYEHWSELKRVGVLRRLHRIMKEHAMYGCSVSLNRGDYDEIILDDLKPFFGKTYYGFAALGCLEQLNAWCDGQGLEGLIHYVFADLAKQGADLDRIFRTALNNPSAKKQLRLRGMWSKGLMWEVVQLQAADIIAYEINKRAVNDAGMGEPFLRKSLANLHLHENFDAKYYGRDELNKLVSDYRRGVLDTY
jgi:hypothetical protein